MSASAEPAGGEDEVRAAGGLVWRRGRAGHVEILLVHRPRYDDWSLPKGKCDPGESDEDCALREVLEETGVQAKLEAPLAAIRYRDRKNRPKVVRYWRMQPIDPPRYFIPNDEVDETIWCSLEDACRRLTYEHDRELVTAFRAS